MQRFHVPYRTDGTPGDTWANVDAREMGTATAPVTGSGSCAWVGIQHTSTHTGTRYTFVSNTNTTATVVKLLFHEWKQCHIDSTVNIRREVGQALCGYNTSHRGVRIEGNERARHNRLSLHPSDACRHTAHSFIRPWPTHAYK